MTISARTATPAPLRSQFNAVRGLRAATIASNTGDRHLAGGVGQREGSSPAQGAGGAAGGFVELVLPAAVAAHVAGHRVRDSGTVGAQARPKPAPFTLDPQQAVGSLDRIEAVDATWVLPGHGPAWDGGVAVATRLIRRAAAENHHQHP